MTITLNGEPYEVKTGISIRELVLNLELDPKSVAVEQNLQIVPKSAHETTLIKDGDALEIVEFVGGG